MNLRPLILILLCASCVVVVPRRMSLATPQLPTFETARARALTGYPIKFQAPVIELRTFKMVSQAQPAVVTPPRPAISQVPMPVSLLWTPSPSEGVAYYNIYYGTAPRDYSYKVSSVSNFVVITGLRGWTTYYFAATADDGESGDGDYSEEGIFTPELLMDVFPGTPNSQLLSGSDYGNWHPRAATYTNGAWRVTAVTGVAAEFYRLKDH